MNKEITHERLFEFIESKKNSHIDFAQHTYKCGAIDFVDQKFDFDHRVNKQVWSYKFKDLYLESEKFDYYPYFIISIPGKSYLMYELNSEIFVWVCYTEEPHRGKGYMTELLNFLKHNYPEKRITVDTFNESLRKLSIDIGINLFHRKS